MQNTLKFWIKLGATLPHVKSVTADIEKLQFVSLLAFSSTS